MKRGSVKIMLSYARSGGTILNRCLACLPNIIIFSEINPEATWLTKKNTIQQQARYWYKIKIKKSSFINEIHQIKEICEGKGYYLIIRDFSYGSFIPRSYNSFKPSFQLFTLDNLIKAGVKVTPFAFVRNAKDIWLSMKFSKKKFHDYKLNGLYKFTQLLIKNKIKLFKYEDFCLNPELEMKKICRYLKVPYSNLFKRYISYFKVTGDIDKMTSRGLKRHTIITLPRRSVSRKDLKTMKEDTKIEEINKMLNYKD